MRWRTELYSGITVAGAVQHSGELRVVWDLRSEGRGGRRREVKVCESVPGRRRMSYTEPRHCRNTTHVCINKIIYILGKPRDKTSGRLSEVSLNMGFNKYSYDFLDGTSLSHAWNM